MSATGRQLSPKIAEDETRKNRSAVRPPKAFLQAAVETMARIHSERGRCVFAFTAPNRRAGVTYVVNLMAKELASQLGAKVAVISPEALKGCDPGHLPQGFTEQSPNLWIAVPEQTLQQMPDFALENVWISPGAKDFDFVLIDCPALDTSAQALRWTSGVDGVLLVVEAGKTRVDQIETAQRLLQTSSGRLAGLILNRRTYPIPKFLYKLL